MINFFKSLLPNLFFLVGYILAEISMLISKISMFFYLVGTNLHIKLKTKFGHSILKFSNDLRNLPKERRKGSTEIRIKNTNDRLNSIIKGNKDVKTKLP
jgi:hypothetical protein